jgi:ATP-binding cassette subfamily B protein
VIEKKRLEKSFIPWLFLHFKEYLLIYLVAFGCLYFLHYFQAEIPRMVKNLTQDLEQNQIENGVMLDFLFLALVIFVLRTGSRWLFFLPARYQQKNLRLEFLNYLGLARPELYKETSKGQLYQYLVNDFNRLRGLVGFAFLQLANIVIALVVILPKVLEVKSSLVLCFIPAVVAVIIFSLVTLYFRKYLTEGIEEQEKLQNFIIESYHGKKTVKTFNKEDRFSEVFDFYSNNELHNFFIGSVGSSFSRPLIPLGVSISFLWGGWEVFHAGLGISTLVWFSGFLFLLLEPLMMLAWIGLSSVTAYISWKRLKAFLLSLNAFDLKERENTMSIDRLATDIVLDFTTVRLKLKPNEALGICGDTGIGKSFFLIQLCDYLDNQKASFSLVHQTPIIFNASIFENLYLKESDYDENLDKLDWLFELFELDIIKDGDQGYHTIIGEMGKNISGGQAKRLCLLRSLLQDTETIVWDDPFSSIDAVLERRIMNGLKAQGYFKNKFLIFTSHRLTSFKFCEKYLFLQNKKEILMGDTRQGLKNGNELFDYFKHQNI